MSTSTSTAETGEEFEHESAESTYERIEAAVDKLGEVMVRTESGKELELHRHNAAFEDEPWVEIDADDAVHWLDARSIERYWIHEDL